MTMKKPEPQAEYDFRTGVRGKHHRAFPDANAKSRGPAEQQGEPARKPADRAPKPVKP